MKYAIVGSGAVGGYYGGRLAAAGFDVHFLYHTEFEAVRRNGLTVRSCDGDFHVPVLAYDDARKMPQADIVINCLKHAQSSLLSELLPPLLQPGTIVASLQNGLGSEDFIAGIVGPERVIAGSAFICAERESPGVISHTAAGGLRFAAFRPPSPEMRRALDQLAADFKSAKVKCSLAPPGLEVKWAKLVWNVPFSGLSIFYRGATTDTILADPERLGFARDLMADIIAAARADDVILPGDLVEKNVAATYPMGAYRPSMLVDYEKGRELEIEPIIGQPLRRARGAGIAVPALERLHSGIQEVLPSR